MENLIIEQTESSPRIVFDPSSATYEITGRSFPENPVNLFETILNYVNRIFPQVNHEIKLRIEAEYFNSVSSRYLLVILRRLAEICNAGKHITIVWLYEDDETLRDGEMFQNLVKIPFEFVIFES
jgi:hypothetical protein